MVGNGSSAFKKPQQIGEDWALQVSRLVLGGLPSPRFVCQSSQGLRASRSVTASAAYYGIPMGKQQLGLSEIHKSDCCSYWTTSSF